MKSGGVMAKRRGPEPKPDGRREAQVAFRGRPGYVNWVVRLARKAPARATSSTWPS